MEALSRRWFLTRAAGTAGVVGVAPRPGGSGGVPPPLPGRTVDGAAAQVDQIPPIVPSGDTSGATDTANLNAAITAAAGHVRGRGRVVLGGGNFHIDAPLIARSKVWLQGSGEGVTELFLVSGSNCDVIRGHGFADLTMTGTAPFAGGVSGFTLSDMLIDGNAAGQATPGYGYRLFGYANTVRNVVFRNTHTHIWHECGPLGQQDGPTDPGSECEFSHIRGYLSRSHGMVLLGPSDCLVDDVTIGFSNTSLAAVGIGLWAMEDGVSNIMATAPSMDGIAVAGFSGTFVVQGARLGGATDLYATSGTVDVVTSSGTATMTYAGKTAGTLTGCSVRSGAGRFVADAPVTSSTVRFTTAGLLLHEVHPFGCAQSWNFVLDATSTASNCHSDGAEIGGVLVRGAVSWHGGEVYDFSTITTGCGFQLGDTGSTAGVALSAQVEASGIDVDTHVVGFNLDRPSRAAVNWLNAVQARVRVLGITQTTGDHTATVAAGSNGVDVSTWRPGSPGTLMVDSTNEIPNRGGGVLAVPTAHGPATVTYAAIEGASRSTTYRSPGTAFTGCVASGAATGATLSTGAAVTQANQGTVGIGGSPDNGSQTDVHICSGGSTASSTQASYRSAFGPHSYDLGVAPNAFRLKTNGTDQVNLNTASRQLQMPNGQQIVLFSDNYATKQWTLDGTTAGLLTGPARNGKPVHLPGELWVPGDSGLVTANFDPVAALDNTALTAPGVVYLCKVHCPASFTATNLLAFVQAAGVSLVAGRCFMGLYTAGGSLVGSTADLSAGPASFGTAGSYTFALAGGPRPDLAAGDYYVALVFNGTTGPSLARGANANANWINAGTTATSYRFASTGAGVTTGLPATLATPYTPTANAWWVGVS